MFQLEARSQLPATCHEGISKGRFLVAGHSKGGNLATYACSYLPDSLFERVDAIYSYDAPGLNKAIIETEGYQRTSPNIRRFVPQGSIVGMMLEVPEPTTIVKVAPSVVLPNTMPSLGKSGLQLCDRF